MKSLSARLLVMTIGFVMLSEVFIFAPSIANFRVNWMVEKLGTAHLAILTLDATPDGMVSKKLEMELLRHVGAKGIAVKRVGVKIALINDMPPAVDATYDLRNDSPMVLMSDAFATLFRKESRIIRVVGNSPKDPETEIDLIIEEAPLHHTMVDFSSRIFLLSLLISAITACLVYLTLQWMIVRPMRRISGNMVAFSENPEEESRIVEHSTRSDEIGTAQRQLADLQRSVHNTLRQKQHLAALGTAVAKINHDLRGILSTVLLVSDRLEASEDPEVKRISPILLSSIDRAVNLCEHTLNYVGKEIPPSKPVTFLPIEIMDELQLSLPFDTKLICDLPKNFMITFDRDQMYRVLNNLTRNAAQAGAENITITGNHDSELVTIDICDDGPGLPPRAQEKLFIAFEGSARKGGAGLGLAIARELLNGGGADLKLQDTGPNGSIFRIILPARSTKWS